MKIFSMLSVKDLDNTERVSKEWSDVIDMVWKCKLKRWVSEHHLFSYWDLEKAKNGVSKQLCKIIDPKQFGSMKTLKRHSCHALNQSKWSKKITVSEIFHEACSQGLVELIRFICDQGENMRELSMKFGECGRLPLWAAAIEGHTSVVELFYDTDINLFRDTMYSRVKFKAEAKPRLYPWYFNPSKEELRIMDMRERFPSKVTKFLYGVGVYEVNPCGRYRLWTACYHGDLPTIKQLCALGADVNKSNISGKFPLWFAAAQGYKSVVKVLLNFGAILDKADHFECTSLWVAAKEGHSDIVKLLCSKGVNVNQPNCCGQTPLWIAAKNGHCAVVSILCENGAEINRLRGSPCNTEPLWIALYQGHTDVIKILCKYGVNIHETNWYGQSPKSFAYFQGNEEIFELFCSMGMCKFPRSGKFPNVAVRNTNTKNGNKVLRDRNMICPKYLPQLEVNNRRMLHVK